MRKFLPFCKRKIKVIFGREYPFKEQMKYKKKWYGNDYGGFYIGLNDLKKTDIVYSFGIGEDISFDESIMQDYSCKVYGFDPTPKSINWVKTNKNISSLFCFNEYGIDAKDGFAIFYPPKNPDFVSGSLVEKDETKNQSYQVPVKTLDTIMNELGHSKIKILKMDIEGAEYHVIPQILNSGVEIEQILIEFHHRFFPDGFQKTTDLVKLLNQAGYSIFAVSDTGEEVSFIKVLK